MQKLPLTLLSVPSNSDGQVLKIVGGVVTLAADAVGAQVGSDNTWTGIQTFSGAVNLNGITTTTTQAAGNSSVRVATTAFVGTAITNAIATKANLASPTFTGNVTVPTLASSTSNDYAASTQYVKSNLSQYALTTSPTFTGTPAAPTPSLGTTTTQLATAAYVYNVVNNVYAKTIPLEVLGKMTASEKVRLFTAPWGGTINAGISPFTAGVAATASTTITVLKNGTQVGTLVWAANATAPTVNFTTTTFSVWDVFTFVGPATPDSTLADITGYLKIT